MSGWQRRQIFLLIARRALTRSRTRKRLARSGHEDRLIYTPQQSTQALPKRPEVDE